MRKIKLTKGYYALVDDSDYERVVAAGPWCAAEAYDTKARDIFGEFASTNFKERKNEQ